jgi:SUMO ligase MMS21 Smc5/6 complex component
VAAEHTIVLEEQVAAVQAVLLLRQALQAQQIQVVVVAVQTG